MKPWCALIVISLVALPVPGWGQESLSLTLAEALERNNANAGGAYIEHA
jgi:hypothetical protein